MKKSVANSYQELIQIQRNLISLSQLKNSDTSNVNHKSLSTKTPTKTASKPNPLVQANISSNGRTISSVKVYFTKPSHSNKLKQLTLNQLLTNELHSLTSLKQTKKLFKQETILLIKMLKRYEAFTKRIWKLSLVLVIK